jgi:hypothetical protein
MGCWLHPHHNLGMGDQTHAASLPIYSFAEAPAPPTLTVPEPRAAVAAEAVGAAEAAGAAGATVAADSADAA